LSQIARIETRKINPTLCTMIEIAKTLDIDPKELLDFEIRSSE
jgi:transcriptional regulator with XRE-family HTH domain